MNILARRLSVFIELSGSKINGAYTHNDSAFSYALRTEMITDLKHHARLDSPFELRQVLYIGNIGLFCFGCNISNRLRFHMCRLLLFRIISADILIHSAVQKLIIGDILRNNKAAAFS